MTDFRIALVSRELYPLGGAGIGNYVAAAAELLAQLGEVTVVTTSAHEQRYHQLRADGPAQLPSGIRVVFVPEPTAAEVGSHYGLHHLWSSRAFETLCDSFPDGGPDLVEFPDYLAEGAVAVQAKRSHDPRLRRTLVCVRCHTSAEMCGVLNGYQGSDTETARLRALERYALRFADRLLWPGGDVLGTYRRFYGAEALAPAAMIRHPYHSDAPDEEADQVRSADGHVRLLYAGRLERRKGVQNLLHAVTGLRQDTWSLTLVGGDTDTAALGLSMRDLLALMAAADPRIELCPAVGREEVVAMLRSHDVMVVPSLWECWPYSALEALQHNRPLIATPVGGLREMVRPGRSGWLASDTSGRSLADTIERVLESPDELTSLIAAGSAREVLEELADPSKIQESYAELLRESREAPRNADSKARAEPHSPPRASGIDWADRSTPVEPLPRQRRQPLVSAILTYFRLDAYVEEAIRSVVAQTYAPIEIIVVNDGSFREQDEILEELAERYPIKVYAKQNAGLGTARNFGIAQSRGSYIVPIDADNTLAPQFVQRCLAALEADPKMAYVTTWASFIDEDGEPVTDGTYHPIGNFVDFVDTHNVAGDATALLRRRLFELGFSYDPELNSYEDWLLYRQLAESGHYGHAIPDYLFNYRVRAKSMVREYGHLHPERLRGEMEARLKEHEVRWQP